MKPKRNPRLRVPKSVIEAIPIVIDIVYNVYTRMRQQQCKSKRPKKPEPPPIPYEPLPPT